MIEGRGDDRDLIGQAVRILAAIRAAGEPSALGAAAKSMHELLTSTGRTLADIEALIADVGPIARVRLRRWSAVRDEDFLYLVGIVEGHPRIPDGHWARTSPVLGVVPGTGLAVTASGRLYQLLDPLFGSGGRTPRAILPDGPTLH